jgi:hypothetical protein
MPLSENWAQVVWNPDALGNKEKKLWAELEPKIRALLEELKENGHIETVLVKHEAEALRPVGDKFNEFAKLQNTMNHIFEAGVSQRFLAANKEFGLTEPIVASIWESSNLLIALLCTELFKLLILFHLKRGLEQDVYKIARFTDTMSKLAPNAWKELREYVDNDFRNSIAHGTFAFLRRGGKSIVEIYRDATLTVLDSMELHEFMIRAKEQNVLFICGFAILYDLRKKGWFT